MRLKLKNNYWENWMAAFDSDGIEFRLMNNEGVTRPQMFGLFRKIGLKTPINGYYNDFIRLKYENNRKVVIYDDINSHFGQNKRVLEFSELKNNDKSKYLCEYITFCPNLFTNYTSKSTRYLFVGNYGFQYNYYSYDDWRSNCGDGFISDPIKLDLPKWRQEIPYAMFAIDFVGEDNDLRAIDFNCAPGVQGVKLNLSATQMVLSIKEWLQKYVLNDKE